MSKQRQIDMYKAHLDFSTLDPACKGVCPVLSVLIRMSIGCINWCPKRRNSISPKGDPSFRGE